MELPHLGRNCALPSCNRLDFLPHQCSRCLSYFCEEHKLEHSCTETTRVPSLNRKSELCPICERSVVYVPNEDINITMEKHMNNPNECVKKEKLKCPIEGCKEKLFSSNQFECVKCKTVLCLKHRHMEHKCEEIRRSRYQPLGKQKTSNSAGLFMLHGSKKKKEKTNGVSSPSLSTLPSTCDKCHQTFPHRAAKLAHRCYSSKNNTNSRKHKSSSCAVS